MNKIWWLWVPLVAIVLQFIIEAAFDAGALAYIHSEGGPHEILQFIALAAAFVIALCAAIKLKEQKWLAVWFGFAALCCFYVGGEEISWGQHILNWSTPEHWATINDQQETNLHNTSSWLDQKPRLILLIGIIVGGLIIPALRKFKSSWLPAKFEVIYPPNYLAIIAVLIIGLKIIDEASEALGIIIFERESEVEELFMYYFVFLYLLGLKRKVLHSA